MIGSDLKYKRYILGLKAGCSLFILYALFSLSYYLFFPELNPSETAFKIHVSRTLFSVAFYSLIIFILTRKNYLILLIITILWHTIDRYYLAPQAFELNHQAWNLYAIFGGKFLDYLFTFVGANCEIALCFANFYATLTLLAISNLTLAPMLYKILTIPQFYFSSDPQTIVSDALVMNKVVFLGNIQVSVILILGTIWIAWRLEKVTEDAARQERSSVTLGRYFSPDIRQEIENESFLDTKSSKKKSSYTFYRYSWFYQVI